MAPSWFKLLIVVLLIVVIFGRGKISDIMGDFAKGIKSFKKGLSDDEDEKAAERTPIEARSSDTVTAGATPRENVRAG
jgi:sec-independent protein translocase protein TatA